jgi:CxC5 like cysteine cluster associated with KDZ transposases
MTGCLTNYHNNFSVCNDVRTYYAKKPPYIQVGEHQYVEGQLIDLWTGQMLLGWYMLYLGDRLGIRSRFL